MTNSMTRLGSLTTLASATSHTLYLARRARQNAKRKAAQRARKAAARKAGRS